MKKNGVQFPMMICMLVFLFACSSQGDKLEKEVNAKEKPSKAEQIPEPFENEQAAVLPTEEPEPKKIKFLPPPPPMDPNPEPYPNPRPYLDPYPVPEPVTVQMPEPLQMEDPIYDYVEEQPSFPGGTEKMMNYVQTNLKYPEQAVEEGIEGRVFVGFVVRKDGSLTDVSIKRGVHPLLDKEAKRIVTSMPNWIPGKQNGKSVNVRMIVPVKFQL